MTVRRAMQWLRGPGLGLILALYFIGHGLMLLNKGYYWDDWTFYNIAPADALGEFVENGNLWFGHYLRFLFVMEPIVSPKVFTFAAYLLAVVLLDRVLRTVVEMTSEARFFVVLFFALFPVNFARVQVVPCAAYAACYMLFFLGFFLTARFEDDAKPKLASRLLAHVCFLTSFFTNSLLVFYALVLLYLAYRSLRGCSRPAVWRTLLRLPLARADFFVTPIAFWGLKRMFFMSKGPFYEGNYNVVAMSEVRNAPLRIIEALRTSFLEPIAASAHIGSVAGLVALPVLAWMLYLASRPAGDAQATASPGARSHDVAFLGLGALAFSLGVFPYIAVGKMPISTDWDSRHQMLVPFGASLLVYYSVRLVLSLVKRSAAWARYALCVLAVAFIARNIAVDIAYQQDWFKQMAIVENVRKNPAFRAQRTFLVDDQLRTWNTLERNYRFYEYTGLLKYALGDETHCALGADEIGLVKRNYRTLKRHGMLARYNLRDYVYERPRARIILSQGPLAPDRMALVRLMLQEHFQPPEFRRSVAGLISLEVVSL